jgi:hypothetical protein
MRSLILIILISLSLPVLAGSGCFKEPQLNIFLESKLKMKCRDFPSKIADGVALEINASGVLVLYQEDFARFLNLYKLQISGRSRGVSILVRGDINLQNLGSFNLLNKINKLDYSRGSFLFGSRVRFEMPFLPDFLRLASRLESGGIKLFLQDDEVIDLKDFYFSNGLVIEGGKEVKNLRFNGEGFSNYFSARGKPEQKLKLELIYLSSNDFSLRDVEVTGRTTLYVNKLFQLVNTTFEQAVKFGPLSRITWLSMENSHLEVDSESEDEVDEIFSTLDRVSIKNSKLEGVSLPGNSSTFYTLDIRDSDVLFRHFPNYPNAKSISLTGTGIKFSESRAFVLNEKLESLNLSGLDLKELRFNFHSVKNLTYIYLMGNPDLEIDFQNKIDSQDLPKRFMMVVDKKSQALKLRKYFGRDSIGFLDWLPLK